MKVTEKLVPVLGPSKLLHFTTIEKLKLRVSSYLGRVTVEFVNLTRIRSQTVSSDASGVAPLHASHYFALRTKWEILSSIKRRVKQKEMKESQ